MTDMVKAAGLTTERVRSILVSGTRDPKCDTLTTSTSSPSQPPRATNGQRSPSAKRGRAVTVAYFENSMAKCSRNASSNLSLSVCRNVTAETSQLQESKELHNMDRQNAIEKPHTMQRVKENRQEIGRNGSVSLDYPASMSCCTGFSEPDLVTLRVGHQRGLTSTEGCSAGPAAEYDVAAAHSLLRMTLLENQQPLSPEKDVLSVRSENQSSETFSNPPTVPTPNPLTAMPNHPIVEAHDIMTDQGYNQYHDLRSIIRELREHGCSYEAVKQHINACLLPDAMPLKSGCGDAEERESSHIETPPFSQLSTPHPAGLCDLDTCDAPVNAQCQSEADDAVDAQQSDALVDRSTAAQCQVTPPPERIPSQERNQLDVVSENETSPRSGSKQKSRSPSPSTKGCVSNANICSSPSENGLAETGVDQHIEECRTGGPQK
ncbi:uncharacterized protein LOC129592311 [Paramacrobiotus metropolitanus]|uniref:uncharacterized protein LOC129592311 n=1 Tax=Paramacrobiotus metropolitanus TaxID=2943436 RepID=UPI002445B89B|nr:uncharacterized protein LOC129592311 [Paramacrobiotus metropolitanus]